MKFRIKSLVINLINQIKKIIRILFYLILKSIPYLFITSIFKKNRTLNYFYDRRLCTYRYDSVCGLLLAATYAKLYNNKEINIIIYEPYDGVRRDGPTPDVKNNDERLHYLISIVFESFSIVPNIHEIKYIRSYIELIIEWYKCRFNLILPKYYIPFFPNREYTEYDILRILKKNGKKYKVNFKSNYIYNNIKNKWLKNKNSKQNYITLTLRNKTYEHLHYNTDENELQDILNLLEKIYKNVIKFTLLIVPDFADLYKFKLNFLNNYDQDYIICDEAALSIRFRMSLYEGAVLNIGKTNGPLALALMSDMPLLYINADNWESRGITNTDFQTFYENSIIVKSSNELNNEFINIKNLINKNFKNV